MKAKTMSEAIINQEMRRGWVPYRIAARQYLGVSEDLLLGAMKRHELKAFKKPITRKRTTNNPAKQRTRYFVSLEDVDEWIRTYWEPAFADS